jgi:hypothetical protein
VERLVPETTAARVFDELQAGFERAVGRLRAGVDQAACVFGGQPARVRVGGGELFRHLMGPFEHLRADGGPDGPASLDVSLWDENATGVQAARDALHGQEPVTDIAVTGRFVLQRLSRSVTGLDRRTGRIVGAVAWDDGVDVYQRGKPLARLLAEWYADRSVGVMHAGLVARGTRAVLLAGREGAGKSTLALACVRAGLAFLGEDYAALEFRDDGVVVGHSVYNSVFLTPESAGWFPDLAPHLRGAGEDKSVVLVADVWPSRLLRSARIAALAICRVTGAATIRVRPATRAEALLAVAPSSLLSVHGRRADSLERLARLVERVPAFRLDLGTDLAAAVAGVDEILARTG